MAKTIRDLESLYDSGEAPNAPDGFRGQDVNGTTQWRGTGWNRQWNWPSQPEVPEGGAWPGGRSNRSGE